MSKFNDFIYQLDGHTYILEPEWSRSGRGCWIKGVMMFSVEMDYIGYWHRENMPIKLIGQLVQHVKRFDIRWRVGQSPEPRK